jgi:UDP-N-acetylglucosamine 2-epimerase (non-hydrolysing)
MIGCDLVLTDSGGMQEEGCALGRPVLVLRDVTERPEAVECGAAVLVGARTPDIIRHTERVMLEPGVYAAMARPRDVFGDGLASERIADILAVPTVSRPRQACSA